MLLQFPDLEIFFGQLGGEHRDEFIVSGVNLAQRDHTLGAGIRRCCLVENVRHARRLQRGREVGLSFFKWRLRRRLLVCTGACLVVVAQRLLHSLGWDMTLNVLTQIARCVGEEIRLRTRSNLKVGHS